MPVTPPAWGSYVESARRLGARLTMEALVPGRSAKRLDGLARRLQRELDGMMRQAFDAVPGPGALACMPGCDHCCRTLPVTVGPMEVLVLMHRVRELAAADPALAARIVTAAPQGGPAARTMAAMPDAPPVPGSLAPCPLLGDGGLCLVYSTRPLACRGCVSGDAAACAACDKDVPVPRSTAHQLGAAAISRGICDALERLGLPNSLVELRAGLAVAFADEDVEKRWLRGEDVFGEPGSSSRPPRR